MNDILYAPEFYIPTPANDIENMGKLSLNVISAIGKTPGGLTSVNSYENSFRFSSLDKPIIDLRPIAVVIDGQREEVTVRNYTGLDIFCNHALFSIKLQNCSTTKDGAHELKIIMHYKNIYSMTYQKIYTTRISVQSGKIVNHNWGTLSRAKRTGKREK